jgi:glyoxylase-like metal-dependent hydrolase (beta-lactamase superfamily II)
MSRVRSTLVGAILLVCSRCAGPSAYLNVQRELTEQSLGVDALIVRHDPGFAPANVLAARMPDGTIVLCSSPYDTEATRLMVRRLRQKWGSGRVIAINVHFHPDGTAGNAGYALEGVETYGSELTADTLARRGRKVWDVTARGAPAAVRPRLEATPIVPPSRTFRAAEGLRLTFGGEAVQVFYPGPGHSPDNVVVYFPSRRLLFGGDLIRAARAGVGYRDDAELTRWPAAIEALSAFPADVVVPGHGAPGGAELLAHTLEVVREASAKPTR